MSILKRLEKSSQKIEIMAQLIHIKDCLVHAHSVSDYYPKWKLFFCKMLKIKPKYPKYITVYFNTEEDVNVDGIMVQFNNGLRTVCKSRFNDGWGDYSFKCNIGSKEHPKLFDDFTYQFRCFYILP